MDTGDDRRLFSAEKDGEGVGLGLTAQGSYWW